MQGRVQEVLLPKEMANFVRKELPLRSSVKGHTQYKIKSIASKTHESYIVFQDSFPRKEYSFLAFYLLI